MRIFGLFVFIFFLTQYAWADCTEKDMQVLVNGQPVHATLFEPESRGKFPTVVSLAPSVGVNPLDGIIASDLCKRAVATMLVEVYSQEFMTKVDSFRAIELQNQFAMVGLRKLIDKLSELPEIDAARIGMLGSSLGGIFGALYFPTDNRISIYVNILGAENIPEILAYSDNDKVTAFRERMIKKHHFRSIEEFITTARRDLHLDPMNVNTPAVRDRILQVMLDSDETVPYRYQEALWHRTGEPSRILLHGSTHTEQYIDFILYRFEPIADFLAARLSTPRYRETIRRAAP